MNKYNPVKHYKNFKKEYLQFVVFIKNGKHYCTYDSDAKIVSYICNMPLVEESIKIPKEQFGEIVKVLHDNNLNVALAGSKNVSEYYTHKQSRYMKVRAKSKEIYRATKSSVQ